MNKTLPKKYSVEFFHIYTDEKINLRHIESINQLKKSEKDWGFSYELIVLIDNYNPEKHTLKEDEVLNFLTDQKINLDFWAFEKDLIKNAEILLDCINNNRILKNYRKYIERNNKYPCSLLTSAWYLTRLGYFTNMLDSTTAFGNYQNFVIDLVTPLYNSLGWDVKSSDKWLEKYYCDYYRHGFI